MSKNNKCRIESERPKEARIAMVSLLLEKYLTRAHRATHFLIIFIRKISDYNTAFGTSFCNLDYNCISKWIRARRLMNDKKGVKCTNTGRTKIWNKTNVLLTSLGWHYVLYKQWCKNLLLIFVHAFCNWDVFHTIHVVLIHALPTL